MKCYDYKLNSPGRISSSLPAVHVCNSSPGTYGGYGGYGDYYNYGDNDHGSVYCATITFKNGEDPDAGCGGAEFCTERGCISSSFCKQLGTHEHTYPMRSHVKVTMTCCEGDLCNIESSAQTFNYTNSVVCIIMSSFLFLFSW